MLVRIAIILIELYRRLISPLHPPTCRFSPSCSQYAQQSFREHGLLRGGLLTLKRIIRCHPFGAFGYDPVPLRTHHCGSDHPDAQATGKS